MTRRACPVCAKETAEAGYCCSACLGRIRQRLRSVPALVRELDQQLLGLRRGGQGGRSAETPMVFLPAVATARDELRSVLVGWCRDLHESHGWWWPDADSLIAMAGCLSGYDWRRHPAVDEFDDELGYAVRNARHAIDLPPDRVYLGTCSDTCEVEVWAPRGHLTVACPGCGGVHDVAARQEWLTMAVNDRLATATVIAQGLAGAAGVVVAESTLRSWVHRGRLLARGHDQLGRALYRVGDCVDLAVAEQRRRVAH